MDKDYFIKLTFAVYRVTELFPDDEPLKSEIRKSANKILADLILISTNNPIMGSSEKETLSPQIIKEIEVLGQYFLQSQRKNWINPDNFLILEREYDRIKKSFAEGENREEKKSFQAFSSLSSRKKKILNILKKEERLQVGTLQKNFHGVSKRTLRRDLEDLCSQKLVKRVGKWNKIFYKVVDYNPSLSISKERGKNWEEDNENLSGNGTLIPRTTGRT